MPSVRLDPRNPSAIVFRFTFKVFALFLVTALSWPAVLGQQEDPGGPEDRTEGEGDRVERRQEWFYSSRRDGTTSVTDMAARWRAGVEQTRQAILVQRARRGFALKSGADVWVSKGPSPSGFGGWTFGDISGRISALEVDWNAGILYLGTASGGVWKSVDDGTTWTSLFDDAGTMTIGAIELDPNDPATLWVGTGENNQGCESYFGLGLMRSTDGGVTWEIRNGTGVDTLEDLSSFANIVVDPRDSNHIVTGGRIRGCSSGAAQNGGIYTSDDGGATWTKRLDGLQVYEIQQDPAISDTFWAGTNGGIYRSTDNAETWDLQTKSKLPNGSTGRTELAVAPSNSNTIYVLFQTGGFWRTTNGGNKWTRMGFNNVCDGQCSYNSVLAVDPFDRDTVIRGNIHVYRTLTGGDSWSDLSLNWGSQQKVHQDTHVVQMDPVNAGTFYVGSDGGLWKTIDYGSTFENKNGNLNITQFYAVGVHPTDTDTMCAGTQDNSSLGRTGTGDRWELQVVTGDGFVCHFNPVDPSYAYTTSYPSGGRPSIYRSTSGVFGGYSRITNSSNGMGTGRANWVTPYVLDPQSPNVLYVGTERIWRSLNHGSSWSAVGPSDLTGGSPYTIKALDVNRDTPAVVFAGTTDGRVWRTVDGGSNWTDLSAGLPSRQINDVAADPWNPDRAFAVVGGFGTSHVWEWTLAGGWVEHDGGLPDVPHNTVLMRTSQNIFVGNDVGLFRSIDGGTTFEPYMDGLPQGLVVTDLRYSEGFDMITAGTYGRGAWQVTLGQIGTGFPPGTVQQTTYTLQGDGDIEASWSAACNEGDLPGQTYSLQVGDLDLLASGGGYSHAPLDGDCGRAQPAVFTPGAGNEYYLVVPNEGGREGGAGADSDGAPRPQTSTLCGTREVATCP